MSLWYCEEHGLTNKQCCGKTSTATLQDGESEEDVILGENFYDDLTELIEKYEGMEMTNAECVGYLMFKVNEIMTQQGEDL